MLRVLWQGPRAFEAVVHVLALVERVCLPGLYDVHVVLSLFFSFLERLKVSSLASHTYTHPSPVPCHSIGLRVTHDEISTIGLRNRIDDNLIDYMIPKQDELRVVDGKQRCKRIIGKMRVASLETGRLNGSHFVQLDHDIASDGIRHPSSRDICSDKLRDSTPR